MPALFGTAAGLQGAIASRLLPETRLYASGIPCVGMTLNDCQAKIWTRCAGSSTDWEASATIKYAEGTTSVDLVDADDGRCGSCTGTNDADEE
jgi:hypothetical protein